MIGFRLYSHHGLNWILIGCPPKEKASVSKCIFPQFSDVFIQFLIISQACSTSFNRLQIYVYTYYVYIYIYVSPLWFCRSVLKWCVYIYTYIPIKSPFLLVPIHWIWGQGSGSSLSSFFTWANLCQRAMGQRFFVDGGHGNGMFYHGLKGKSPCVTMFLKGNHHVLPCV